MNIYVLPLHLSLYYSRNLVVCALEIHISVSNISSQISPVTRTILHCIILGQGLGTCKFFPLDFNFSSFLSSFIMAMRLDGFFSLFLANYSLESAHSKTANKMPSSNYILITILVKMLSNSFFQFFLFHHK